jgi:hypothetical protein
MLAAVGIPEAVSAPVVSELEPELAVIELRENRLFKDVSRPKPTFRWRPTLGEGRPAPAPEMG